MLDSFCQASCITCVGTGKVPTFMLFGRRLVARKDSGKSASFKKQCKPLRPGDQPLAKEPEDSGYETGDLGRSIKQNKTFYLLLSIITRRIKL